MSSRLEEYHVIKYDCKDNLVHFNNPCKFIPDTYYHYKSQTIIIPFKMFGDIIYYSFFLE